MMLFNLRALSILKKRLPEDHPYNHIGFNNFKDMVQAALDAGQADQLSDHPFTQDLLRQLSDQRNESTP
ncbi:MAG: hypothetical protein IGR76_06530 [Synechococcales cyanobacterium T60_A2020_003]|nr:hypothetical protein [Synechococcales cyanobacterium T60_A2020_003]